jgi:hypothetical protein
MAYANYADMEAALDQQIIAQLCGDAGTPMPGPNPATDAALDRATSLIRSYVRVGGIYTETELAALDDVRGLGYGIPVSAPGRETHPGD